MVANKSKTLMSFILAGALSSPMALSFASDFEMKQVGNERRGVISASSLEVKDPFAVDPISANHKSHVETRDADTKVISPESAKRAAVNFVKTKYRSKNVWVQDIDLEHKRGDVYYEVELSADGGREVNVEVNAKNGKIRRSF
ncbi:MAG: PepSY domain-containing protein [Neisseria sp.]|nr:PepSY domain-containing protein [Neisseria sp.]